MFQAWWRKPRTIFTAANQRATRTNPTRYHPCLEVLEDRCLLSGFTVTDSSDSASDTHSLRYGLANATAGETINFAATLTGSQTIKLNSTLSIGTNVTIDGTGCTGLTISGQGSVSGFFISSGMTVTIRSLSITQCSSTALGGGISNQGTLTLTNCTLSYDSAADGGGISNQGTLTLTNCTLSYDSATSSGGGIFNVGTLTLTNCTLSNDSANIAGGIYNVGTLTLTNCTLNNDSANIAGGGIYNVFTLNLANTLFAGNDVPSNTDDVYGTVAVGYNNLFGQSSVSITTGSGNLSGVSNPGVGSLAPNGGPTETVAISVTSPARLAGASNATLNGLAPGVFTVPSTDQRGISRVGGIDIGAYQYVAAPTVTTSPSSTTVKVGKSVTFTAVATGTPTPTVQWQVSTNGGKTFTNIPGATSTTLTFITSPSENGYQYQAIFTNAAGSITTKRATLTVGSPIHGSRP